MALPDWFKVDLNRFRQGGFTRTLMMGVDADNNVVPMSATGVTGDAGGGTTTGLTVLSQTSLTVDGTSRALTVPAGAVTASLQLRGCDAYVRLDAQPAVAGNAAARLILDGSEIALESASELSGFRIVAASGTGTLSVAYFGTAP